MPQIKQDRDTLPLYGSVTGITLPSEQIHVARGVALRRGLFDTFSTPMMGFAEPASGGHTPGPWVPVNGCVCRNLDSAILIVKAAENGL